MEGMVKPATRLPAVLAVLSLLAVAAGCAFGGSGNSSLWIIVSPETSAMDAEFNATEARQIFSILFLRSDPNSIVAVPVLLEDEDLREEGEYLERLAGFGIEHSDVILVTEPSGSELLRRIDVAAGIPKDSAETVESLYRLRTAKILNDPQLFRGNTMMRYLAAAAAEVYDRKEIEDFLAGLYGQETALLWMKAAAIDISDDKRYVYDQEYLYQVCREVLGE